MLLEVRMVCPGTDWVPGQTVDATPEQAEKWADGFHARVIREQPVERRGEQCR